MQQTSSLMFTAFRRGLLASQHAPWTQQLAGFAASANVPDWASKLPAAWQEAAKPGSSYRRKMNVVSGRC